MKPINLAGLAIISGGFGGALTLAVGLLAGWPWIYSLVSLAGISAITWLALMRKYLDLAAGAEPVTLQPSKVYPTTTRIESTRIEIVATDPSGVYQHGKFADLPVDLPTLITVARWIAAGSSFSLSSLGGPGRPLSRAEFECLRDAMIARGLCYWINEAAHAQGCRLTRGGEAVIKHFANFGVESEPIPQLPESMTGSSYLSSNAHAHMRTRGSGGEVIIDS